jgi:hypothetical protein
MNFPAFSINSVFDAGSVAEGVYFYEVKDVGRLLQSGKLVKVE